ncbi:MAG: SMP-30/gluconolactonase/LRE family protein [Actinomycetota bacterium]|nr:SMP-30/gluconolactonase/LRE family protein [Actinomycetota bacterium]
MTAGDGGVKVEVAVEAHAQLGEGPVWDETSRQVVWVDIMACVVHCFSPDTGADKIIDVGQPVGAVAVRTTPGLVLAMRDGFGVLDTDTGDVQMIADTEAHVTGNRMNDGKCDSAGRFWAGTMAFDEAPAAGALYRLDQDHGVEKMIHDVSISNGLCWSSDDRDMYYIDSPTQGVDVFDFDAASGELSHRRRVVDIPEEAGLPDGMTIDDQGFLWVALYSGGAVRRYSPEGELDRTVELPATQITSCTFGGDDFCDLYITSAAQELSEQALVAQPHAGALFVCRPGPAGLPANHYTG